MMKREDKEAKKADKDLDRKVRDFMCENFYDIRTFGAVMTTFTKKPGRRAKSRKRTPERRRTISSRPRSRPCASA